MVISKWISFSQPASSASDTPIPKPVAIPCTADGKQFGLENFGNTCYANSVLQALYFCSPFRELVIQYADPYTSLQNALSSHFASSRPPTSPQCSPARRKPERKSTQEPSPPPPPPPPNGVLHPPTPPVPSAPRTLFSALRALYIHISQNPVDKGTIAPRAFIEKLRELNEAFRNTMHQDAHEFLNYLLNRIVEEIEEEKKQRPPSGDDLSRSANSSSPASHPPAMTTSTSTSSTESPGATFIHRIFEGTLTSETRCLTCENLSSRDESFLDLSIDIEQNSSVSACLRQFSASEMLCQKEKFFCDACCELQEAERRMKIKRLPNVLALHLKRFKYQEDVQRYAKLTYRVAFPFELRLFNTVDDIPNPDRLYELFAIVVHIGNGPNHGHYVSIIKTMGTWLVFDDETVDSIKECDIPRYFGDSNSGSAYVLYYQALDIDLEALGLRPPSPGPAVQPVPQSDQQPLHPSDSPVSTAQSIPPIPPLPPGLIEDLITPASVPEAHTRPTTPPISTQPSLEPKSPRKVPSQFLKAALTRPATAGHKPLRNDAVVRPSRSVVDEKLSPDSRPNLPSIGTFPRDDLRPLDDHSAAVNGKEKDPDKGMMGWLRWRPVKASKSRPSLEINPDTTSYSQDVLAVADTPVRKQSTCSSSNSSRDSRRRLDSPTPGHASPLPIGKLPQFSRAADMSPYEAESRQSSGSGSSYAIPISSPPDRRSQQRLPAIPASPQTPKVESPSALFTKRSLDHSRVRRSATSSARDPKPPLPPRSPSRPTTSSGIAAMIRSPPPSAPPGSNFHVPNPGIPMHRSDLRKDVLERPKSAHASYGFVLSPPTSPVPPLPGSATGHAKKSAMRKLSLSAPMLGLVRRDKDKQ